MNICEHGNEVFINETYTKVYTECKDCKREADRYRSLERLMRLQPHNYLYCSNHDCNNIFNKVSQYCKKCGSEPDQEAVL